MRNPGTGCFASYKLECTHFWGFSYVTLHPGPGGWLKYRTPIVFLIRFVVQEVRIPEDILSGLPHALYSTHESELLGDFHRVSRNLMTEVTIPE